MVTQATILLLDLLFVAAVPLAELYGGFTHILPFTSKASPQIYHIFTCAI